MKFTLNTKPLKSALDLTIISSNISKFYERSSIVELTVSGNSLRINTQAISVTSEATVLGNREGGDYGCAIVDNNQFKQLISTIDDNEMTIEFSESALIVHAGQSRFTVPLMVSGEDAISLPRPEIDPNSSPVSQLHPDVWKYIQDHQLYALCASKLEDSKSYAHVWVSKDKGIITGDPDNSLFTYQPTSDIDSDCLIAPNIVNLLASLDPDSNLYKIDDSTYVVEVIRDSLTFRSQFKVAHEGQDGFSEYASDLVFDMVLNDGGLAVSVPTNKFVSSIKQASLFTTVSDDGIEIKSNEKGIYLFNDNVNCKLSSETKSEYESEFSIPDLDTLVSHMDGESVDISPIIKEGEVFGIRLRSGDMVALLGGND